MIWTKHVKMSKNIFVIRYVKNVKIKKNMKNMSLQKLSLIGIKLIKDS